MKKYELHGLKGIFKRLKSNYDGNFKQNVIEYMHANHLSATQIANHFRLGATNVVLKWERIYLLRKKYLIYLIKIMIVMDI